MSMKSSHAAALAIRPSNVVRFEQLMYFTVAIEVILGTWNWNHLMAENPHSHVLVAIGTILAPLTDVLFIWLVARRRKSWVRWLMLPGVVIGIPYGLLHWSRAIPVANAVLIFLLWSAETIALFLIFTGNAREWFANDAVSQLSLSDSGQIFPSS